MDEWLRWGLGLLLGWTATVGTWLIVNIFGLKSEVRAMYSAVMTRKEHAEVCENNEEKIRRQFEELKEILREQNEHTRRSREIMTEHLQRLTTEVEVLKFRLGERPKRNQ